MTTTQHTRQPILVVGGTGKTGRRVAERLTARGVPVRIASRRSPTPFDWEDPTTWGAAIDGTSAAYVSYYPDLAAPGAPEAIRTFTELALDRGVRRIVLLSGRGEVVAQQAERVLFDSGADATVVRCAWFMQNFSEDFLHDAVMSGELVLPGGDRRDPWVDADDIADVAVAALTGPGHVGELYELTSPRAHTMSDVADLLSAATGRAVRYVPVSVEEFAAGAAEQGVPEELVGFLTYLFSDVYGNNADVTDGVHRALGRPARDFEDFARDAAAAGAWDLPVSAPAPA